MCITDEQTPTSRRDAILEGIGSHLDVIVKLICREYTYSECRFRRSRREDGYGYMFFDIWWIHGSQFMKLESWCEPTEWARVHEPPEGAIFGP